jgi:hypothetical protein
MHNQLTNYHTPPDQQDDRMNIQIVCIATTEIRECMLSLGAEFVVFQFANQKLKD